MKKFLSLAALVFAVPVFADTTYVSGVISSNTVWDTAGSPYVVTNNILVDTNVALTIQPGVVVLLDSSKYIRIKGSLSAIGTITDSIIFTKNKTNNWYTLEFQLASSAVFEYCRVSYARSTGIQAGANFLSIAHSNISCNVGGYKKGGGISIDTTCNKATITNSTISNNSSDNGAGIYVFSDSTIITGNIICNNTSDASAGYGNGGGIYNGTAVFAMISNNIISNNVAFGGAGGGGQGGGIFNDISQGLTRISNNIITFNKADHSGAGIHRNYNSSATVISDNIIANNTAAGDGNSRGGGIFISGTSLKQDTVRNNMICDNMSVNVGGAGIYIEGERGPVTHNTIANNFCVNGSSVMIWDYTSTNNFTYNTILDTCYSAVGVGAGTKLRHNNIFAWDYALYNENDSNVYADSNWWGTTDTNKIDSLIYDYYDDFNYGRVYYKPFLQAADTIAPPYPPFNVTADSSGSGEITISWDSVEIADLAGYKVWYDSDTAGFFYEGTDANEGNSPIDVGNVNTFTLTGLTSSIYYVAVTAYDNGGDSSWYGAALPVYLTAVEENSNLKTQISKLEILQNPIRNNTVIRYSLPFTVDDLRIAVFDLTGREVATLVSGEKQAGNHVLKWNSSGLKSGIYFITLKANNSKNSLKVVKF